MDNPNYIDELDVETIHDLTADSLLESLSLEIMETSINNQITEDIGAPRNFLETVLLKFDAIQKYANRDSLVQVQNEIIDWAESLNRSIINRFNLAYMAPAEDSTESLEILEALYNFFILDRHRHTVSFFTNYISTNKNHLIDTMGLDKKGMDITTMANKKRKLSKTATIISANLVEVIDYIVEYEEITPDIFFESIDDGDMYVAMVREMFDNCTLAGDFFKTYVERDTGDFTGDMTVELRVTLRSMLLEDLEED